MASGGAIVFAPFPVDLFDQLFNWLPIRASNLDKSAFGQLGAVQHISLSLIWPSSENTSERLGALFVDVDEDNDVWMTFDENLWPETKDLIQALTVAKCLGIEWEQSMAWRKLPFAWPGLGGHSFCTLEYTKMMLDA